MNQYIVSKKLFLSSKNILEEIIILLLGEKLQKSSKSLNDEPYLKYVNTIIEKGK